MTRLFGRGEFGRAVISVLRVTVSGGLIAFLLYRADLSGIGSALFRANLALLLLACVLFLLGQGINTERWRQILILGRSSAPGRGYLLRLVLAGMFFNMFLPSIVGGDVVRAEMARVRLGSRADAYVSIAAARFLAFLAVIVIGSIASVVAWQWFGWYDRDLVAGTLAFLLPALVILGLTRSRAADRLASSRWQSVAPFRRVAFVVRSFRGFTGSGRALAFVFGLSILAQLVGNILVVQVLAASLGIQASVAFHLVAVPLITLITLLPVSINGIGVREGGFVYFYSKAGVPGDDAIALSLAYTVVLVLFSLMGGLYVLLGKPASELESRPTLDLVRPPPGGPSLG